MCSSRRDAPLYRSVLSLLPRHTVLGQHDPRSHDHVRSRTLSRIVEDSHQKRGRKTKTIKDHSRQPGDRRTDIGCHPLADRGVRRRYGRQRPQEIRVGHFHFAAFRLRALVGELHRPRQPPRRDSQTAAWFRREDSTLENKDSTRGERVEDLREHRDDDDLRRTSNRRDESREWVYYRQVHGCLQL